MSQIILASSSPRRCEIMKLLGKEFKVDSIEVDETIEESKSVQDNVKRLAYLKAKAVAKKYPNDLVIGADTVVCLNDKIIGKPENVEHARVILKSLSGTSHEVVTGVCIIKGRNQICFETQTLVYMNQISDYEIEQYIKTNEPMDKAGAYGIQGKGAVFVKEIRGDFYNVMGLPINRIYNIIKEKELI